MKDRAQLVVYFVFFAASLASAVLSPDIESQVSASIKDSMCFLYEAIWQIVGPIAVMFLVWFGMQYVGAGDDVKRREKAKRDVKDLLIALIFITVIHSLVKTIAGATVDC